MAGKKKVGGIKPGAVRKRAAPRPPRKATTKEKVAGAVLQSPVYQDRVYRTDGTFVFPCAEKKKVGGVKASAEPGSHRGARKCDDCTGFHFQGNWHHDLKCPRLSVMWKAAGFRYEDWPCIYNCEPTVFPSAWVHKWNCPFWKTTNATPFDKPAGTPTPKVES